MSRKFFNNCCSRTVPELVQDSTEALHQSLQAVLKYAMEKGDAELVGEILSRFHDIDLNQSLIEVAAQGLKELALVFIDYGADALEEALDESAKNGHQETTDMLIEKSANLYVSSAPNGGENKLVLNRALRMASRGDNPELVSHLVEQGADDLAGAFQEAQKERSRKSMEILLTFPLDKWVL